MTYSKAFFLYATAIKICDALTVYLLWQLAFAVRFRTDWIPAPKGVPDGEPYRDAALPLVLVFSILFHVVGAYRSDRISFGFRALKKIAQGSILGTLVFVSTLYFLWEVHFSRVHLAVFPWLAIAGLLVERGILHLLWKSLQPAIRRLRVLLVGHGELMHMYVNQIAHARPYPVEWLGRLGPAGSLGGLPWLGTEDRLEEMLRGKRVDSIVIAYPPGEERNYGPLLEALSRELVDVKVVPDFGRESTFAYHAEHECGIPLLAFNRPPVSITDRFFKRAVDIVGALFALVFLAPVFLVVSLLVKLTSRGPVFYAQSRVGADGRVFTLYKFRSMRVGAEAATGPVWAKENDDRTTTLGRWLRRTSLDELPQFYNVLRGDMSLVGPRPERPVFVEQFRKEIPRYMLRHKMKSGLTGWAQVNGWRGDSSLEERIRHDLYYIRNWSHRFDFKILVLTLFRGFVNRNAY